MTLAIPHSERRIGLLAGWGRFPIVVAETLREQGYQVYCLGVKDHADPILRKICHHFTPQGSAKLGAAIRYYRRYGITEATMAGKFFKVDLIGRFSWVKHLPDWQAIRTFAPHFFAGGNQDKKDDSLLLALVNAFAKAGVTFAPATDYAPELLVKRGTLAGPSLREWQTKDVQFGWELARQMGGLDVGQSVCVTCRAVLAVEAVEGTDACIRRAGELCSSGKFTVVKVAKPKQDMRFDVPTIGLGTLQTMHESGANVLAIEAGKTIFIDQPEVLEFAQKHRISIISLDQADLKGLPQAA